MTARHRPTAIVTGAASGIGRALATTLRKRGTDVVLVDRDADALAAVARATGGTPFVLDVTDADAHDDLAEVAGVPDLLCLNAGVVSTIQGAPWEAPPDEWQRVFDVNVGGVVNGLRTFVPLMLATGRRHSILITASLAGLATWPGGGPYAASKHAAVTVAEQAALALADTPVTVTVLCPALVQTGMSDTGADPADVADQALAAADKGTFAVVPDGWSSAITSRAHRLATGQSPSPPTPD